MATMAGDRIGREGDGRGLRYTNVAIVLHWAIALGIIYNLATGLFGQYLPRGAFAFHISSGITVLALTVVRVVWRLTHRPPPKLPMPVWDKRLAAVVHFIFYAGMIALPLSGWALISANPPVGSAGAAWAAANPTEPGPPPPVPEPHAPRTTTGGPAGAGLGGGHPPKKRGPTMIWGLFRLPPIGPINEMGRDPAGVPTQREAHERIETIHLIGGWAMLALLVLHIAGALKHQYVDRERELARMGLGRTGPRRDG